MVNSTLTKYCCLWWWGLLGRMNNRLKFAFWELFYYNYSSFTPYRHKMFAKISKYGFEIIIGIVVFGVMIYFLPTNKVIIPDIGDLEIETVDLAFVMDEDSVATGNNDQSTTEGTGDIQDTGSTWAVISTWSIETDTWSINDTGTIDTTSTGSFSIVSEAIVQGWKDTTTGTNYQPQQADTSITYDDCETPWGNTIAHGDSVIAYEQRFDDPGICNVQRRVCTDGSLNGSYEQPSCKEYLGRDPRTQEIVLYNSPRVDDSIQPQSISKPNTSSSSFTPSTTPGTTSSYSPGWPISYGSTQVNNQPVTIGSSSSTTWDGTVCNTPWWEQVRNGQFVKSYKSDKGFSNMPCEVELRYCVQTVLDGSFQHPSCQHYDIAVEDYLQGYFDPNQPSAVQLVEILHGSADDIPAHYGQKPSLWQYIQLFFRSLF